MHNEIEGVIKLLAQRKATWLMRIGFETFVTSIKSNEGFRLDLNNNLFGVSRNENVYRTPAFYSNERWNNALGKLIRIVIVLITEMCKQEARVEGG